MKPKATNMGISNVAKKIIIEELKENVHVEKVEDVIYWALKHYAETQKDTFGGMIAYSIIKRIEMNFSKTIFNHALVVIASMPVQILDVLKN